MHSKYRFGKGTRKKVTLKRKRKKKVYESSQVRQPCSFQTKPHDRMNKHKIKFCLKYSANKAIDKVKIDLASFYWLFIGDFFSVWQKKK
jgi:hypothetical protein